MKAAAKKARDAERDEDDEVQGNLSHKKAHPPRTLP